MLACVCATLFTPLARALPIHAGLAQTRTDSLRSDLPAVADAAAPSGLVADMHLWVSGTTNLPLTDT